MEAMSGKMEVNKTFRMDENFSNWLSRQVLDLDCTLSDLIRTSLLLATPLIQQCPRLLRTITLDDYRNQQD